MCVLMRNSWNDLRLQPGLKMEVCASDNAPVTAHLLMESFFLMTVHSQKNGQVRRGGRKAEKGERYKVRKADMGMGTIHSNMHSLTC